MKILFRHIIAVLLLVLFVSISCQPTHAVRKSKIIAKNNNYSKSIKPIKASKIIPHRVNVFWKPVKDATIYRLQVSQDKSFQDKYIEVDKIVTSTTTAILLKDVTRTYFWRVMPGSGYMGNEIWGQWGYELFFSGVTPEPPILKSPLMVQDENNAEMATCIPVGLTWYPVDGAIVYRVQVSIHSDFSSLINNEVVTQTSYPVDRTKLTPESPHFYWRVRAGNMHGWSDWSKVGQAWGYFVPLYGTEVATLISPPDGTANEFPINLDWSDVTNATNYKVYIDDDPDFLSPQEFDLFPPSFGSPSNFIVPRLTIDTTYYWRVLPYNICGQGSLSSSRSFVYYCPDIYPTTLWTPTDNAANLSLPVSLLWYSISGATKYQLQLDGNSDFSSPEIDTETTSPNYSASNLGDGKTYSWRVRGYNGCDWGQWSPVWQFTTCIPLVDITLSSPSDGKTLCDVPELDWDDVDGATKYQVQIDDDPGFGSPKVNEELSLSKFNSCTSMFCIWWPNATTYYWRVRAYNGCDWGTWSSTRKFTTKSLEPILLSPTDNATDLTQPFLLDWEYLHCNEGTVKTYDIHIDDNQTFDSPVMYWTYRSDASVTIPDVGEGITYYWRVRARYEVCSFGSFFCSHEYTRFSDVSNFTTLCPLLQAPTLVIPSDGAVGLGQPLIFDWDDVDGATKYQVQIDDDSGFSSLEMDTERLNSDYFASSLTGGTTYYWRVRSWNNCGWSDWSNKWNFTPQ
jgi:hypothetical protein